jgi:hypothetical protein
MISGVEELLAAAAALESFFRREEWRFCFILVS